MIFIHHHLYMKLTFCFFLIQSNDPFQDYYGNELLALFNNHSVTTFCFFYIMKATELLMELHESLQIFSYLLVGGCGGRASD